LINEKAKKGNFVLKKLKNWQFLQKNHKNALF